MAARTVEAMSAELARFMPPHLSGPADPILGAYAAAMQSAEQVGEDVASNLLIGGATGKWLELIAKGMGITRARLESDASLRQRMRSLPRVVTRANILAAVDDLLVALNVAGTASMWEWFEGPYLGRNAYLGRVPIVRAGSFFILVLPDPGAVVAHSFIGRTAYAGRTAYLGTSPPLNPYLAVIALVNAIKAAGVGWKIFIDRDGVYS